MVISWKEKSWNFTRGRSEPRRQNRLILLLHILYVSIKSELNTPTLSPLFLYICRMQILWDSKATPYSSLDWKRLIN